MSLPGENMDKDKTSCFKKFDHLVVVVIPSKSFVLNITISGSVVMFDVVVCVGFVFGTV